MCYLIAKDIEKHACYVLKTMHGKHLVELKRFLNELVARKRIQLVTISRSNTFGENALYCFAKNEEDFVSLVKFIRVYKL